MRNGGDQRAIRISDSYADHQGGTNLPGHPEIEEPGVTPDRRHSRLASNRSAASAISESSKSPESNGTARRSNSTLKTGFSSSGSASKSSRSRAVCLLTIVSSPFPRSQATPAPRRRSGTSRRSAAKTQMAADEHRCTPISKERCYRRRSAFLRGPKCFEEFSGYSSFATTTVISAVTSLCSFTGTLNSPNWRIGSSSVILRRSMV